MLVGSCFAGRFSNGPVFPEYMASNLNLSYYDYGAPGATSGAVAGTFTLIQGGGNVTSLPSPNLAQQVEHNTV